MSYSIRLNLVFGFKVDFKEFVQKAVKSHTTKTEGKFHLEDHFNPKTGEKLSAKKVWDEKPIETTIEWLEINDQKIDIDSNDFECLEETLSKELNCLVEIGGDWISGIWHISFSENSDKELSTAFEFGSTRIYNDAVSLNQVQELTPKLMVLKNKLNDLGLDVGDPEIFINTSVG